MAALLLIFAVILNTGANILLKIGSTEGIFLKDVSVGIFFQKNWQTLLGLALFALNVFFYFIALKRLPLSVAYPVMVGGTFVLVNTFAAIGLGEQVSWQHLLGYALILAGVTLVSLLR